MTTQQTVWIGWQNKPFKFTTISIVGVDEKIEKYILKTINQAISKHYSKTIKKFLDRINKHEKILKKLEEQIREGK